MTALLRKEVRSILPIWLVTIFLATVPVWIVWPGSEGTLLQGLGVLVFAPFGLGVLLLSLIPFGYELNWGTFSVLLAQPVPRRQLWLVKVTVVAVALGLALLALCLSNHLRVDSSLESMKHTIWRNAFERPVEQSQYFVKLIADMRRSVWQDTLLIGGLEVVAGFAGGLWTTLLFRQVTTAFWLTLLVPVGLTLLSTIACRNFPDGIGNTVLALLLLAYSVTGFFWAKRFFLRVQDTQWTGGNIALPTWHDLSAGRAIITVRRRAKPIRALLRKEFQAQQVNVLLAGGLLLVHLGVIVLRRYGAGYLATHQSITMTLEMIPWLWLALPLLIGSMAVAEERKVGVFQSTLCLPVSRRVQFLVKLLVTMLLGFVLGGVVPLLVDLLAPHNSITGIQNGVALLGGIRQTEFLQLGISAGLTWLAFYGSTLTRNALQGMGAGLTVAILTFVMILGALYAGDSVEFFLWRGRLIFWIGWPVMGLTLFLLAYRNHSFIQPDLQAWSRNGATLLAALLCVTAVTTVIYHRAWEAWMPVEPTHSLVPVNSMWERPETPLTARSRQKSAGYLGVNLQDLTPTLLSELKLKHSTGALVGGVTHNGPADKAGLKERDLVLGFNGKEISTSRELVAVLASTPPHFKVPIEIERAGSNLTLVIAGSQPEMGQRAAGRSPKVVARGVQSAVILPDGRLWLQRSRMRFIEDRNINRGMVAWYAAGPRYSGYVEGSDWKDVAITQGGCFGLREDGTLWDLSGIGKGAMVSPRMAGEDKDWATISAGYNHFSALKSDGTLWQWGWKATGSGPQQTRPRRVGIDNGWTAVSDYTTQSAAIKADGSVWRWDWRSTSLPKRWLNGACSEPVSFTLSYNAVASVCLDGTLWIGGDLGNSAYARLAGVDQVRRASYEMVRWGNDSDWKEIRFVSWGQAAAIKRDGSLWQWDAKILFGPASVWMKPPIMLSRYADWITVCDENNAVLALARDGSLCLWGDPEPGGYDSWDGRPDSGRWLMPSRIKAKKIADLGR